MEQTTTSIGLPNRSISFKCFAQVYHKAPCKARRNEAKYLTSVCHIYLCFHLDSIEIGFVLFMLNKDGKMKIDKILDKRTVGNQEEVIFKLKISISKINYNENRHILVSTENKKFKTSDMALKR